MEYRTRLDIACPGIWAGELACCVCKKGEKNATCIFTRQMDEEESGSPRGKDVKRDGQGTSVTFKNLS